jgi:hypothetical protein
MYNLSSRFAVAQTGAVAVAALLLAAPAALAQMAPGTNGSGMLTGPVVGTAQTSTHREAPPPALPGARSADSDPAPADRPASDMHPTEALFDSVNRGDITSARDAIGRGADLNAHNVLGLTALDLAVDLGRNDITFLLLSLRGASGGGAPTGGDASRLAAPVQSAARAQPVHHAVRAEAAARPAPPPQPRQYADNPGTPVPQAGFLGFGGVTR